jgi:hypothetical protein
MTEERDLIIERVRGTLREGPGSAPDARAVARVLSTVWASPRPSAWRRALDAWRMPAFSGLGAATEPRVTKPTRSATAATAADRAPEAPTVAAGPATGEYPVQLAANVSAEAAEAARIPTQFVFDGEADQVSLVGDFNGWATGATPLTRLPSGLWTATVPLPPGRHVYAFVLDGTLLVADPRAPKAGDADYGREGSVVMVFAR